MGRGLICLLLVVTACSQVGVDLEVSTSVIDIPTTSTSAPLVSPPTSTRPATTTTVGDAVQPVIPDAANVVPLRFVPLADDDGGRQATIDPAAVADWVIRANEIFAPARIGFSYDPGEDVEVVTDTLLNEMKGSSSPGWEQRVARANDVVARYPGEAVVLVTGVAGLAEFGSSYVDFLVVGEPDAETLCGVSDPTALAHRLGLYLGLPHTFASIFESTSEAADALSDALQSETVFDGDSFASTLPDPGVYAEYQCEDVDSVRIGGLQFELPRTNLMSHFPERAEITLSQADRVRWFLELRRSNGMALPANDVFDQPLQAQDLLSATAGPCGLGALELLGGEMAVLWIGSDQLVFPAGEGCRLEFTVPVPEAGSYELWAMSARGPAYGAIELLVGDERSRLEDLYAPVMVPTGALSLGQVTLDADVVVISVEVIGANALSSGASVPIDGFALVPTPSN